MRQTRRRRIHAHKAPSPNPSLEHQGRNPIMGKIREADAEWLHTVGCEKSASSCDLAICVRP